MNERVPCEFFLVRYVPDVVKGEFVNIGVVLREAAGKKQGTVRFTRNWSRVRCLHADADLGYLEGMEEEILKRVNEAASEWGRKPIVDWFTDALSNSLQISESRGYLALNLQAGLEELSKLYVEPMKEKRSSEVKTGRPAISGAMRMEFERAGVWGLMRKRIAASEYTRKGDTLRIDCGYRPNGVIRMFHAVSLQADVEQAKILSFGATELRAGVKRVEGAELELTAVVEDRPTAVEPEDEAGERYRFGMGIMEREAIRVITVRGMARAAETARTELRV